MGNKLHNGNIILVGLMGSGKTTLGKALAKSFHQTFIDTDTEIEKNQGKTIPQLFSEAGEERFRSLEAELLHKAKWHNSVIATGGGMPCFYKNIDKLLSLGLVVYLKADAHILAQRLVHEDTDRPLLQDNDKLEAFVSDLLKKRRSFYKMAHITVDATLTVAEIVEQIQNLSSLK